MSELREFCHTCAMCHKPFHWNDESCWYGNEDEDGYNEKYGSTVVCSEACRVEFCKKKKIRTT